MLASYRGVDVDRMEFFTTANPRVLVLKAFGLDIEILQGFLRSTRGRDLERWYAVLLQLLGFSAAHYWGTQLATPDLLAFPESGTWLLVVECTESETDLNNKLGKLSTRTKMVRQALEGMDVFPVVVTAMSRSLINKTESDKAAGEKISVVTADELPALLQMAREGTMASKVRDYLLSLVPSAST